MKTVQKITLFIAFVALLASCQSGTNVNKILSNQDTKKAIMDTIANDSNLSVEMMEAMMSNENSKMMMMGNEKMTMMMEDHASMMRTMKDNPEMMQKMMENMMQMCENDSAMRSQMTNMMTEHPEMMKMCMQKMKEKGMMNPDGKMMNMEGQSNHDNHNH